MTKLDSALALAKRGFLVFPLAPNSKLPALEGDWRQHATCDPAKVRAHWQGTDRNIGLWTKGLVVLDFDTKRDGLKDLEALKAQGLDCSTMVRTASGGIHVYLRSSSGPVANSVGKIAPGTDIRGESGYVVAPGSTIDGRKYEWMPQSGETG